MFLPFLQHLTYDFKIGSAMRFFKNASKRQYNGASIHPRKKWRRSPKTINLLIFDAPEIKRVSYLCFKNEHTDATLSVTQ